MIQLRKVLFKQPHKIEDGAGFFHHWATIGNDLYGIIELNDGRIVTIKHYRIQFTNVFYNLTTS